MKLLTLMLWLSGCSTGTVEDPLYSGDWEEPQWAMLDDLDLPVGPEGTGYSLVPDASGQELWIDTSIRDASTDAAACGALVVACVQPNERNILGCLQNVPHCPVGGDALCCPSTCEGSYTEERLAGKEPTPALLDAIWGEDSCIPGLTP